MNHAAGGRAFRLGLLLLPASALLAAVCLFVACISGSRRRDQPMWRDRWTQPLLVAAVLMVAGCFVAKTGSLAWAGLANWVPLFWAFWAFQPFLSTEEQRRQAAWMLVAGSVPVLVTGLGQMLLGWEGPWQLADGLIVWFVAPGGQPSGRLSGLFDYANIAGAWLGVVWPLMLAAVLLPVGWPRRSSAAILVLATAFAVLLTQSRNAMGGLVLALPFVMGPIQWVWLLPLMVLLASPLLLAVVPGVPPLLKQWGMELLPEQVVSRLMETEGEKAWKHTRLGQWAYAVQLVAARPWLGWGAAAFSVMYPIYAAKRWHGHSHNLPLELAISHGAPVMLLVAGTVLALLVLALRFGMMQRAPMERAWWTATLVLVVMHATDLPLFDSRLNILGWTLLAGICAFIRDSGPDRDAHAVSPEPKDL